MKRIAIFASGTGTNARKIIEHFQNHPEIEVALVVTNNSTAGVLEVARSFQIPTRIISKKELMASEVLLEELRDLNIYMVVLAGFLLLIPGYLVEAFSGRLINIHPALLPKFGGKGMYGMNVHKAVVDAGETESGITIHHVNLRYDEGATIFQARCDVTPDDTPESVSQKVRVLEHQHFPVVLESLLTD